MSLILELTVPLDTVRGKNKSGILDNWLSAMSSGTHGGEKYVGSSRKKKKAKLY